MASDILHKVPNPPFEVEIMEDYDMMQKGIDWFIEHYPEEYGVLLD